MTDLKLLWLQTNETIEKAEERIVASYIAFLRSAAKEFIRQGRRVGFRENRVVHYGEGGFGSLIIEGNDIGLEVFGGYVPDISFALRLDDALRPGYVEIKGNNISDIKYSLR